MYLCGKYVDAYIVLYSMFCEQWNRVYKNQWWYVSWYYDEDGNFIAHGDFAEEVNKAS